MSNLSGIELIAKEREEQLNKHKRSIDQDVKIHQNGELGQAAIALLSCKPWEFPENWNSISRDYMIDKDYIDRLVISGALIAAEIDRVIAISK